MSKRANGDGSVFFRKKRQCWCAQLSINGKPVVRYAKTKVEASKKLDILKKQRETGELVKTGKMTVSDWSTSWIDFKRSRIKPTTLARYESDIRVNIIPLLGSIRLSDVSTNDVEKLHSTLLDRGMSPNTVRHAHCVLSGMLQDAVRFDMIYRNAASVVPIPKIPASINNILSADEFIRLLEATESVQDRTLLGMAINTGMRSGELLALRWRDVDLQKDQLTIKHTINFTRGGKYTLGEPKTKNGRRTIEFQSALSSQLKLQHVNQTYKSQVAGYECNDSDFVFTNNFGLPLNQSQMPRQVLYPALVRAGVKRIRFQDLRHTCFSHMIAEGVVVSDVSAIAGHASVAFTLSRYVHALPGATNRATTAMEGLIFSTV
jgi:integrase